MLYVGLDIHVKHITICMLNNDGKVVQRLQVRQVDELTSFLKKLPERFAVCYEASNAYGRFFELLSPLAEHVAVAHPGLLRLIFQSKKKNDRVDAEKLAKLLFLDEVPTVHVPPAEVRAWREMINFRSKLVTKRARAKNAIRALLRGVGVETPDGFGLWSKRGIAWLKEVELEQTMHQLKRDLLVEELETLSAQLKRVEKELANYSKDSVAVMQLQSIPGIGLRTAEAVVAFLDDPTRFSHCKQVGAYFGLVPRQDQSGNTNRMGHITREGCPQVRHLLTEAVWQAVRHSPTIKAHFERIHRGEKDRRKIAVVATAHYLIRAMWSMLKNGTLWKERAPAT